MSIQKYIDKLADFENEFRDFSDEILNKYAGSTTMLKFSTEFDILTEALMSLRTELEQQVGQAEVEDAMKTELMEKIKNHEIFGPLEKELQSQLAEFLISQHLPLWERDEFISFLVEGFKAKAPEEIIAELPKAYVTDVGRDTQTTEEDSGKTLYAIGVETLRKFLGDTKYRDQILRDYAESVIENVPAKAVQYAFEMKKNEEEDDGTN